MNELLTCMTMAGIGIGATMHVLIKYLNDDWYVELKGKFLKAIKLGLTIVEENIDRWDSSMSYDTQS